MKSRCVLSLMVARTDVKWIEQMLTHIAKAHKHAVDAIVVFVDTAPLGPAYRDRPGVGTLDDLRLILNRLASAGMIDDVRDLSYSQADRKRLYRKYFGRDLGATHNFRGYPVLGSVYSIDAVEADYVVHFDSDMLLHQAAGNDWIKDGIQLLEKRSDVMFVAPRSGPPASDNQLLQRGVDYSEDDGFFSFKEFTSRKYLFSKERLESLLPIAPQYISSKRRVWQAITGKSALWNFEYMISRALENSDFVRADLMNPEVWTLHTPDHGSKFVEHLPDIITKVEAGWFPPFQAGDYDLQLDHWIQ